MSGREEMHFPTELGIWKPTTGKKLQMVSISATNLFSFKTVQLSQYAACAHINSSSLI